MNEVHASSLFFSVALLISIARSKRKLRTALYSYAAYIIVAFVVLFSAVFLSANIFGAFGQFADDIAKMAGAILAFIYSTKTREFAPRSVYLIGLSYTILLLASLTLGSF